MLTLVFVILMIMVFGKLILLALRATWGIAKILTSFVLLPIVLIGLLLSGLVHIAVPVLVIVGIVSLLKPQA
ncbi:MAG: hypothetical protein Q4B70_11800 [Lachnospiraceae bacterium]|nr:hypothetical protein [Lachnospiraceae bacterium]